MDPVAFPRMLKAIYDAVDGLELMFPGRHFTPDGHMVGSIGEALAEYHYGIVLHPASRKGHDGCHNGCQVQIKTTQGNRIGLSSEPEYLLVLRLGRGGDFEEIYNGPGALVWDLVKGKIRPSNGQHQISLSKLRSLQLDIDKKFLRIR